MPTIDDPTLIRRPDRDRLSAGLQQSRANTLRTFAAYERALRAAGLQVPYSSEVNPPLWELGHVGWFQEYWIGRNPQRLLGIAADPDAPRPATDPEQRRLRCTTRARSSTRRAGIWRCRMRSGRATFWRARSSRRCRCWRGPMLEPRGCSTSPGWRWCTRTCITRRRFTWPTRWAYRSRPSRPIKAAAIEPDQPAELTFEATRFQLGSAASGEFAFDNELLPHGIEVRRFRIDRAPVDNRAFAAFVADGGYEQERHWSADGWAWNRRSRARWPRFWRPARSLWQQRWFGQWIALDEAAPVVNLTWHEAQAWCRWAGRRLPTEFEWEVAALTAPAPPATGPIRFGQVWEWTASTFEPYPGFAPHPYRDYSLPWFGSRQVLRGASFAAHPRLRHPRYPQFLRPRAK